MATVSIKCPNCGGALELDDSKEFGYCIFCGSQVHIQDEKTRVEISGKVRLDESTKYKNYIKLADDAFVADNISEAYHYYTKALEVRQTNYMVVFRKALCAGYLSDDRGLRIEEVVSGIAKAYDMAPEKEKQKDMSEEIVEFALTDKISKPEAFYSSDECARYVKGIYNRVQLLNRLYTYIDKENEGQAAQYLTHALKYCDRVNVVDMKYVAGTEIKEGKSRTVYGTYPVPKSIIADVKDIRNRLAAEYNNYLKPGIETAKNELADIQMQINGLPSSTRILHAISNGWIFVFLVIIWVCQPSGSIANIVLILIVFIWILLWLINIIAGKKTGASKIYKQLKDKKKEIKKLKSKLK